MKKMRLMQTAYFETPIGIAKIVGNENGVSEITVIEQATITQNIPQVLQEAVFQITEYFYNKRTQFTFAINPIGTDFQQKVWRELCTIPFGKTVSYLELSKKLGDVKAIRAVASANGKNPLWIVVPCHRVIGSNGSLTGYAGGLWRKKWLLDHENQQKQQTLFNV